MLNVAVQTVNSGFKGDCVADKINSCCNYYHIDYNNWFHVITYLERQNRDRRNHAQM